MRKRTILMQCIAALTLLAHGCASTPEKHEGDLGPRGARAAAVLGKFIAPTAWDGDQLKDLVKSIHPLQYHGTEHMGKTTVYAKFLIPDGKFDAVLAGLKQEHPDYSTGDGTRKASGQDGGAQARSASKEPELLSWWKPESHERRERIGWVVSTPGQSTRWTWLQATVHENGKRVVFLRYERE